jgi:hypothetical protein
MVNESLRPRVAGGSGKGGRISVVKAPESCHRCHPSAGNWNPLFCETCTKLSCRRFKDNEARLQLFALAYSLANFLRQLVLPEPIQGWTLTTLREKLVKIGAKVVSHAKYWSSNWRRWRCHASCSRPSWSGSAGCGWCVPRGETGGDRLHGLRVVAARSGCAGGVKFGG